MNPIYRGQEPPKNTDVLWIKGKKILVYTDNGWEETSTDAFVIDSSMIPNSENPVQSKVIQNSLSQFQQSANQQLALKQDVVTLDTSLSESSVNMIENKAVYDQFMTEDDIFDLPMVSDLLLKKPLTFTIVSEGTLLWKYLNSSSAAKTIEYSKNGGAWTSITASYSGVDIPVTVGDVIQFRGDNTWYCKYGSSYNSLSRFEGTCTYDVSGNIMSLVSSTDFINANTFAEYAFGSFFSSSKIRDAKYLCLPATNLSRCCYYGMFWGSTLRSAPKILPATILPDSCYMFMFNNCTNLVNAPELPAETLTASCYDRMFLSCTNLSYIKCLATDISAYNCTYIWTDGVASTGTFVKNANMSSWTSGSSGIPEGWTIKDA